MNDTSPPPAAQFFPARFIAWFMASLVAGAGMAWLSIQVQKAGNAPVGLWSLFVGAVLGLAMVWLMRRFCTGHRGAMLAGVVCVATLTAGLFQPVAAYLEYRAAHQRAVSTNPKAALAHAVSGKLDPASFQRFLASQSGGGKGWLWGLDAVLTVVTASGIVFAALRLPFCNNCRSWYRRTREIRLDRTQLEQLLVCLEMPLPSRAKPGRLVVYRCRTGCGPGCLAISYQSGDDQMQRQRIWVSRENMPSIETL